MEYMDRARRVGGILWIVAGSSLTLAFAASGGNLGAPTVAVGVIVGVAALLVVLSPRHAPRWWAARTAGILVGLEFLGAVSDRFGLLGSPGASGVSWGDWDHFVDYTEALWPLGWGAGAIAAIATAAELGLGLALLAGWQARWVGKAAAGLLVAYLLFMLNGVGGAEVASYAVPTLVGAVLIDSARGSYREERTRTSRPRQRDDRAASFTRPPG